MTGLVAAEIRKLTSVRSTWVLTLVGWGLVVLSASTAIFIGAGDGFTGSAAQVSDALTGAGGNSLIVLVVALLSMTTEFRHGTVGRTFQITPSRTRVLAAKLAAASAYAVVFVVGAIVVIGLLLAITALSTGTGLSVDGSSFEVIWQAVVANVLTALLGVAFGALVRAQVVAIVVALVWVMMVEGLVTAFLPSVGRWLPFQALQGLFLPESMVTEMPGGTFVPLAGFVALAIFTVWVAAFTAGAAVLLRRRDV